MSFRPTSASRGLTVFLDAGHGGIDPGAVGNTESGHTIFEADETLPMELDAMAVLRARGCTVTVSRTRASTVARPRPGDVSGGVSTVRGSHRDVTARDLCAHLVDADVLIGIYLNAGSSPFHAGCLTAYDAVRFVATIAASKVGQEAIAKGLAKAIEQYFGP